MREDRLPPAWQQILKNLKEGQASKIIDNQESFECVILISVQEPTELPLAQAYPLIERDLLEQKLEQAFDSWVENRIADSDIKIASNLADVWLEHRLNPSNSTYPADTPWLQVNDGFIDPDADPFADEEARELFEQESNP